MRTPAEFVDGFRRFWSAPSLEGFDALLSRDVKLVQPLASIMHGLEDVRASFAPIFAWLPDLRGEIDRWSTAGNVVFIEFRLCATIGGRTFQWPVVDRFVLGSDGLAVERVTYFDPLPLMVTIALRPSGWMRFWQSGAASSVVRMVTRRR